MAEKMRGQPGSILYEALLDTSSTAHLLGGAVMGRTPEEGVCDAAGRVFGHDGLFVADGSLVPANLGVNPALTITALAEHVMSGITGSRPAP
jgi:cholesterol oxidase